MSVRSDQANSDPAGHFFVRCRAVIYLILLLVAIGFICLAGGVGPPGHASMTAQPPRAPGAQESR